MVGTNKNFTSPILTAQGINKFSNNSQVSIDAVIDTGAGISVVHEKWLEKVQFESVTGSGKVYVNASGQRMGTNKFVSFKLSLPGCSVPFIVDRALVINDTTVAPTQLLIGVPEIAKYKMIIDYGENTLNLVGLNYVANMKKKISVFAVHSLVPSAELSEAQIKNLVKEHKVTRQEIKDHPRDFEKIIDGRDAYKAEMKKIHDERALDITYDKVIFDEKFCKEHQGIKREILEILKEYPDVFKNVVGKVPDKYQIFPSFTQDLSSNARMKQRNRSEVENRAIIKKLDTEFQDGILVFPEDHGVQITNYIPLLPVQKHDDDGNLIPKDQGLRVVANCKIKVNKQTKDWAAPEIDNLSLTLRQAAKASVHKYKAKFDISNAFFQVGLAKRAWGKMGVYHPEMGQMCYTRLPQGWYPSFGWATNVFKKIFGRCTEFAFRYMDDCYFSAASKELFLVRMRKILDICRANGITLKGAKMRFFEINMNFLGHQISEGKIHPSPHRMQKAQEYSMTDIVTAADLRKFLGLGTFLAQHLRRSSVVFQHLRKWAGKDGKTKIPWDENNNFLANEFTKAKAALKELCALTPFDENKPAYVLVDSSAKGVGAILYQKSNGVNQICEFFSRKRPDEERKNKVGSCVLELAGMIGSLHYWRKYLEDSKWPVVVFTDSKSLEALARRYAENLIPSDNKLINTFFANLSGLRIKVVHLPGKSVTISGVDHISRADLPECTVPGCDVCEIARTPLDQTQVFVNRVGDLNESLEKLCTDELDDRFIDHQAYIENDDYIQAVVHVKIGNPFKRDTLIFPVNAVRQAIQDNLSLNDLFERSWMIRDAQGTDKHLRNTRRYLLRGELYGPKEFREKTLMSTKKAYLVNNIIKYKKWIGEDEFEIIPIPGSFAITALSAIHVQYGCMSPAQLLAHFRRHFDCPNAKIFAYEFGKKCEKCILLRKDNNRMKPDVKVITPPDKIGDLIFVDEMSRRDRKGQELKILFATEGLSRFGIIREYSGALTSENFIEFMASARAILSPLHRVNTKVTVRTDGASPHASQESIKALKGLGMDLEIYESGTRSKNCIPEQDARCAILSKFLNIAMQEPRFTTKQALNWSILQYNTSLTNLNWSPSEIFANRKIQDQSTIGLSTNELKDRVMKNREKARETIQKRNDKKKLKKRLELIPYANPNLNEPDVNQALWENGQMTLKSGDIVKLNVPYDKNDYNRLYQVIEINWPAQTFTARKANVKNGKIFNFKFPVIDEVIHDYIRFLAAETLKRDKLLLLAWGSNCLKPKLELDYSIKSQEESSIEKKLLNDSGKPDSPENLLSQNIASPEEPEIQPAEVALIPDPRYVPATPETPENFSVNSSQNKTSTYNDSFASCQSHDSFSNMTMSTLRDSEMDQTTITPNNLNDTKIQEFNPKIASSPKSKSSAVEGAAARRSSRTAAKSGQPGAFKKMLK